MKRVQLLLCLLLLLLASLNFATPAISRDWSKQLYKVVPSLAYIWAPSTDELGQSATAACTAFSISQAKGYYLTAAHCDVNDDFPPVFGISISQILFKDPTLDIAVLQFPTHEPSLRVNLKELSPGKEIGMVGYAYGIPSPSFISGNASARPTQIKLDGINPELKTLFEPDAVNGMSGGPVVNIKGEVVGIIEGGTGSLEFSTPIADIYTKTQQFWEQAPVK